MSKDIGARWGLGLAMLVGVGACGGYYYYCYAQGRACPWAAAHKTNVRCATLQEMRAQPLAWVALCGTVFDVTDDPFFDTAGGLYETWAGHDVTSLLVRMGVLEGAESNGVAMESCLDADLPVEMLTIDQQERSSDLGRRRMSILEEWYTRFHTRYPVVAQLSDLYAGKEWKAIRAKLLPQLSASGTRPRGKCPMGFGSGSLDHAVSHADPNSSNLKTITFQGKRYDVTNSSLFQETGEFAHFVGHDVTHALAIQSNRPEDLDVSSQREYSYDEQVLLEKYRIAFARNLTVIASGPTAAVKAAESSHVDFHALVDQADEAALLTLKSCGCGHRNVNQVCMRTTMTPLHKAVEKNRLDLVQLLVAAGADLSTTASLYDDETPLEMAKRFKNADIVGFLSSVE